MLPAATILAAVPALSWQHLSALGVFAGVMTVVIGLARRWNSAGPAPMSKAAERLRLVVCVVGLSAWVLSLAFYWAPSRFDWGKSLPIELCDLAAFIAPIAVISRLRPLRALLHFWGFALCTQFFATPIHRPGSGAFVVGWVLHASVVGSALYDALGLGFRPTWKDLRTAILAGLVYVALVFALNAATGFNYGYVGPTKPGAATIVDALGPWPLRVLWIVLIAMAAMTLVMLVNVAFRRGAPGRPTT